MNCWDVTNENDYTIQKLKANCGLGSAVVIDLTCTPPQCEYSFEKENLIGPANPTASLTAHGAHCAWCLQDYAWRNCKIQRKVFLLAGGWILIISNNSSYSNSWCIFLGIRNFSWWPRDFLSDSLNVKLDPAFQEKYIAYKSTF